MRIVDRKTFMTLPAGTIFAKVPEPIIIQSLHVKGDTIGTIDWAHRDLVNWQSSDTGEWFGRYDLMAEHGESIHAEDLYGRDGCFADTDMFLIFEKRDLVELRATIDVAIALAPSSDT